jgi:DnaD/phage-associated family protein
VLVALCSCDGTGDVKKLATAADCSQDEVRDALAFWRGAGVIEAQGNKKSKSCGDEATVVESKPEKDEKKPRKLRSADELPHYSSDELNNIMTARKDIVTFVDECQNVIGKMLNVKEITVLVGLIDYLSLDPEYVVILVTHCANIGKRSMHYVEKTAFGLYDQGICTPDELLAELDRRERLASAEGKIRSLFGIGTRALTTKEKKFISAWLVDMGYSDEIIKKAYEITADATGTGSIPYANTVIERWNAEGLRTLSEIEASYEKKTSEKPHEGSFDTDEFFEAAVRRSLGEA